MKELIEILTILSKYHPDAGIAGADHDIIYLEGDPEKASPQDVKRLDELGVFEQDGGWAKFV